MNVFKLKTGRAPVFPVSLEIFEEQTKKQTPYFQKNAEGKMIHLAICPQCNNPIQLIGLVRKESSLREAYGKHIPKSVTGLAQYDDEEYQLCPYASHQSFEKNTRKRNPGETSAAILSILRDYFDQAVYLLGKSLGFWISQPMAKSLLENYLASDAHLYAWASIMNLPWMLGYFGNAQSLYRKRVIAGTPFETALKKAPNIVLNEANQIEGKSGIFIKLTSSLMHHRFVQQETSLAEQIKFVVNQEINGKNTTLFTQVIVIDPFAFQNLMNAPAEHVKRKQDMLVIAREVLSHISD